MVRIWVGCHTEDKGILTGQMTERLREVFTSWKIIEITEADAYQPIQRGDTLLVLAGASWSKPNASGSGWLDEPDDRLHLTISAALANPKVFVIPVLLNDTPAPAEADLPLDFEKLIRLDILRCHTERFENDMNRLIHAVRVRFLAERRTWRLGAVFFIAFLLFLCLGVVAFTRSAPFRSGMADIREVLEHLNPDTPYIYYDQGLSSYDAGDYEQAVQNFQKAISLQANFAEAFDGLGRSYYQLNEIEKAQESFNRLVELAPSMLTSYSERGMFYHDIGNFQAAIADFEIVMKGSPFNEPVALALAQSYQGIGDDQKALAAFQRVTQINPSNAEAYRGLAQTQDKLNQIPLALQNYQRYLELTPNPDPTILARINELQSSNP